MGRYFMEACSKLHKMQAAVLAPSGILVQSMLYGTLGLGRMWVRCRCPSGSFLRGSDLTLRERSEAPEVWFLML